MESKEMGKRKKLAQAHVDWILRVIRPLMIEEFIHGYKHGAEDAAVNAERVRKEIEQ